MEVKEIMKKLIGLFKIVLMFGGIILIVSNFLYYCLGYKINIIDCNTRSMGLECGTILVFKTFSVKPYVYERYPNIYSVNTGQIDKAVQTDSIVWLDWGGEEIVHRVVGKCWRDVTYSYYPNNYESKIRGVITKGDNNEKIDGCIPLWDIKGILIWHS